uniref:Transport and golgi organization 6 homolog n=1 Tax=Sinocyclocheilus grahami TaxID=75366 RepID=A0A672PGK3_SINGR
MFMFCTFLIIMASNDGPHYFLEAQLSHGQSTQTALVWALQRNLSELRQHMSGGEKLEEARQLLEDVRRDITWICSDTDDLTWSFVQECLLLLLCLARHLNRLLEAFHQNPTAPNPATPEATLGTVLQFVVTLGLCPYLAPGVGVALGLRSAFGAAVEGAVQQDVAPAGERRLLITTNVLLEVSALSSLATPVFTRHLGDIMAALCQLTYRPQHAPVGLTVEEHKSCKEALNNLLGKVYQPIVIKELLVLQGGSRGGCAGGVGKVLTQAPPWLRRLCGQLLSDRLMHPQGVQAVVRAILEGTGAGGDSDWRKCDAVAKILAACPQQSLSAESYYSQVSFAGDDLSQDAVEEWELTRCIEDVYKICVVGNNPSEVLLKALADVIPTLFSVFCFTKQNVSHLRSVCILNMLVIIKSLPVSLSVCFGSDEGDALYEKVSGEQWRVQCLVQLLGEMKDSDLPGEFFLLLLQVLTSASLFSSVAQTITHKIHEGPKDVFMTLKQKSRPQESIHFSFCIQVVGFIVSMLQRACVSLKRGTDSPVESQTLSMGMGLVATLLSGAAELTADDYSSMDELLPHLEQISQKHPEPVIQELASDLRATIATHGAYRPKPVPKTATQHSTAHSPAQPAVHSSKTPPASTPSSRGLSRPQTAGGIPDCGNSEPSSSKAFSEWLLEACDPDVPSRAVALRSLTRSVRDRDKEALQNKDKLLTLFLENLEHEDSFVYLSAIQGNSFISLRKKST